MLAFCLITCFVNSINCVCAAGAGLLVPDFIYNIGTTMLNGDILMLIFFFVNKIIFPEREEKSIGQYRIILSADTASEGRQMLSQKRR